MYTKLARNLAIGAVALTAALPTASQAQRGEHGHEHAADTAAAPLTADTVASAGTAEQVEPPAHEMLMKPLAGGWRLMAMGQVFPITTSGHPFGGDSPLREREVYFTQPAAMINLESPGSRLVLRTTLNFEAWTQGEGELTYGGWGEGFIDRRHPHTLLHEAMLSVNAWNAPGGAFSLSAGKGFAPYGTDDPMGRPAVKYPTNHHLSQVLERWTVNAVYLHRSGLSVEAGVFGGSEPKDRTTSPTSAASATRGRRG